MCSGFISVAEASRWCPVPSPPLGRGGERSLVRGHPAHRTNRHPEVHRCGPVDGRALGRSSRSVEGVPGRGKPPFFTRRGAEAASVGRMARCQEVGDGSTRGARSWLRKVPIAPPAGGNVSRSESGAVERAIHCSSCGAGGSPMRSGCSSLTCGLHRSVRGISARWLPSGGRRASSVGARGSLMDPAGGSRCEEGVVVRAKSRLARSLPRVGIRTRPKTLRGNAVPALEQGRARPLRATESSGVAPA